MTLKKLATASKKSSCHWTAIVGVCSFILLGLAGLLAVSSCATSEKGLAREQALYITASNTVATAQAVAPALPAPTGTMLEGILGIGGALLALWATHLQRSLADLKNGGGRSTLPTGPPAPPTA